MLNFGKKLQLRQTWRREKPAFWSEREATGSSEFFGAVEGAQAGAEDTCSRAWLPHSLLNPFALAKASSFMRTKSELRKTTRKGIIIHSDGGGAE